MTHSVQERRETAPPTAGAIRGTESYIKVKDTVLWDRKTEGGFPETKELKSRVRNIIEPDRDLGHIDRSLKKSAAKGEGAKPQVTEDNATGSQPNEESKGEPPIGGSIGQEENEKKDCEDCQ